MAKDNVVRIKNNVDGNYIKGIDTIKECPVFGKGHVFDSSIKVIPFRVLIGVLDEVKRENTITGIKELIYLLHDGTEIEDVEAYFEKHYPVEAKEYFKGVKKSEEVVNKEEESAPNKSGKKAAAK